MENSSTPSKVYRVGVDVGGTFTKAVLIDGRTNGVVARSSVHTTHHHESGVAAGVIEVFRRILEESQVAPQDIVFLAHSTTQATNALLEGDVAHVGVVGIAPRKVAKLAQKQATVDPFPLSPGKILNVSTRFLVAEDATEDAVAEAVHDLVGEGATVIVASAAFGVDDTTLEERVRSVAERDGIVTTCGHEITKLYGLATRTKTAVINASILPKMIATANMTEESVRQAGILPPMMIMRGDGGVMHIQEMRRRPALTMLSGPAASVAGALLHVRMSDGIYFEVGGTSTNIGVVKGGRPTVKYARVGGHETYVNSLDIRVLGIAGGSLVRVKDDAVADVGPRSAHIAGLPYAAFADPTAFDGARLVLFEPKPGDGPAFAAVETRSGKRYALTTTCAANALGLIEPDMHSFVPSAAAHNAFALLAAHLGVDVEKAATSVLDQAASKIVPVLESLAAEYKLDQDQRVLIGVGGGVGALIRHVARKTGYRYVVPENAEIISSIGAALAMVREVVERVVPNPAASDILAVKEEAMAAALRLGADPNSIDATVEVDKASGRIRAVASGSAEMKSRVAEALLEEQEAAEIAAASFGLPPEQVVLRAEIPSAWAYSTKPDGFAPIRVVDRQGRMRVQRSFALVETMEAHRCIGRMAELWRNELGQGGGANAFGGAFVFYGQHIIDVCDIENFDQSVALVRDELLRTASTTPIMLVWLPGAERDIANDMEP